jgi:hypothetical protein
MLFFRRRLIGKPLAAKRPLALSLLRRNPLKLVAGRERIYFEHFGMTSLLIRSIQSEATDSFMPDLCATGAMRSGFEVFAISNRMQRLRSIRRNETDNADVGLTGEKASGSSD